jgi:eukaryotic-like serine/threonine-protein kinase
MIEKVWAIWITGVLQPSLPQDILLDLGLTERPALVTRALDLLVQRPDRAAQVQVPGLPLVDVLDRLDRALLILGAPGAGKTTLLLQLARDLLQRAAQDPEQPIPVVFPLSSWTARRRPLVAWLVDELQQRYDVPRKIGQAWVDADQVLPLLDGLDEVQSEHRAACAEAINTFRQDHGLLPLAVCSRITEYGALGVQLRLQGAIVAQPLTRPQVDSYLAQVGHPLAAVREALQEDPTLWELLDTLLMLTIVTLAYAGQLAEALRTQETTAARRQHLFSAYVERMFQRRGSNSRYTHSQTERWLAWLDWQLTRHNQTVFSLERMQPDWLPRGPRWVSTQGARLMAGLIGTLVFGVGAGLGFGLGFGLGAGLIGGLIGGLTGYAAEITPIEIVHWSWSRFLAELFLPSRHGLRGGLGAGFIGGLIGGLICGLAIGLGAWRGGGLGAGLGVGLIGGLGAGLGEWLDHKLIGLRYGGLSDTLIDGLTVGLVSGLGVGLAGKLSAGLAAGLSGARSTRKSGPMKAFIDPSG